MIKPWDTPKVKRVIELFNGHVTKLTQLQTVKREVNADEKEIQR